MQQFIQFVIEESLKTDDSKGIIPQKINLAKKADLITLPVNITGTNCFNCKYIKKENNVGMCNHPEIKQYVNEHNCCAYWDNKDAIRHWK